MENLKVRQTLLILKEFSNLLRRFKWLLLIFAIAGGLVSYFIASNEIPRFRTTVNVVVEPETSNRSEFLSDRFRYYVPPSFYNTQRVVVQSQIVLGKAARSLSPVMVERLFDAPSGSWVNTYRGLLKNKTSKWLDMVGAGFLSQSLNSKPADKPKSYASKSVASKIKSGLQVGIGATQQLLFISMVSTDPLVAAVVANAVADAYISYLIENRVSKTERAGQWLAGKIEDSREKLTAAENALREYQFSEQLLDLSTSKTLSQSRLGSTDSTLLAAEQNYAQLAKKYGPKHPKLLDAKKKLDDARSFYGRESQSDLDSKEGRFELSKLERAVSSNRELYELFLGRFNEVELGIDTVSSKH